MTANKRKSLVALAVGAMFGACSGGIATAATAASTIIYHDNFTGSSTLGTLNGSAPTVDNGNSTTWTASNAWADSGYTNDNGNARQNAFLTFATSPGNIYTLTAGLDVTGTGLSPGTPVSSDGNYWAALGFITSPSTTGGWDGGGASPWVLSGYQAANDAVFAGPGLAGGQSFAPGITSGVNTYSIVLNTGSAAYSYQVFLTNSAVSNDLIGSGTFTSNPFINAVGLQNGLGIAQVSNFSLTSAPAPVPLTWDSSGTSPAAPVDGSGTWNTTSVNWSNGTADAAWSNSSDSGDPVTFGANNGTAGTVTLGADIQAGGLTFNPATSGNYTIAGSGSYTLELTGSSVAANTNATLAANTTFDSGLVLTGTFSGILALTGNNTFKAPITLSSSTLWDDTTNGAGIDGGSSNAPAITVDNGAVLQVGLANTTSSPGFSATYNNAIT